MGKRIAAWIGIGALVLLYVVSLIAALTATPAAHALFMASLVATVFVPLVLWIYVRMYERVHEGEKEGMTLREMRRLNRRIRAGEDPEKLAEEIEENYRKDGGTQT